MDKPIEQLLAVLRNPKSKLSFENLCKLADLIEQMASNKEAIERRLDEIVNAQHR